MRIKVQDRKSGCCLVFDLPRRILEKQGRIIAISDASGENWAVDNGLGCGDQPQWEPVGEDRGLTKLPVVGKVSFSEDSEIGFHIEMANCQSDEE